MAKTWNPGAKRETVGAFLEGWCRLDKGTWYSQIDLFEAYTSVCPMTEKKDLTLGESPTGWSSAVFHGVRATASRSGKGLR